MGQQQSSNQNYRSNQSISRSYPYNSNKDIFNKRIQHQGLLKLRNVPFKNCIEITIDQNNSNNLLFLQNIQITLKDLLESRLYTNKLFPKLDIQRLIENVTYTLAYLQQNGIPYKDLTAQNIYYDQGIFKLLPNQLIPNSTYIKFLTNKRGSNTSNISFQDKNQRSFIPLSPEMIIAYRCKQTQIKDLQILDKSNVFFLGLLLLQVTTLLPSFQCYDPQTGDIYDQTITQRIQMIKQYYSDQIASIIANMLDYDYMQRMNLKQSSIFINREFNKDKDKTITDKQLHRTLQEKMQINNPIVNIESQKSSEFNQKNSIVKSRISSDQNQSKCSKITQSRDKTQKRKNKSNKIYMSGSIVQLHEQEDNSNTFSKQERNKVYMRHNGIVNQKTSHKTSQCQQNQRSPLSRSPTALRQISSNNMLSRTPSRLKQNETFSKNRRQNINQNSQNSYLPQQKRSYKFSVKNQEDQQNCQSIVQQSFKKNGKSNNDYTRYRANPNISSKQSIKKNSQYTRSNTNMINLNERNDTQQSNSYKYKNKLNYGQRTQNHESDRNNYYKPQNQNQRSVYSKPIQGGKQHQNSLHRIKSEIQRSRKLIQQFKRGQNTHY